MFSELAPAGLLAVSREAAGCLPAALGLYVVYSDWTVDAVLEAADCIFFEQTGWFGQGRQAYSSL